MRLRHWSALALVFFATLASRLPAGWALALLPAGARCNEPTGTIWQGHCAEVAYAGRSLRDVGWSLDFWPLLAATVSAQVQVDDDALRGHANLRRTPGGALELRDATVHLRPDGSLSALVPPGWAGTADAQIRQARFEAGALHGVAGHVELANLAQREPPLQLGSYALDLAEAPGLAVSGRLRDTGGPLSVEATLRSKDGREFALDGLASVRDGADPSLQRALEALGPADATGRRSFSVAGTF